MPEQNKPEGYEERPEQYTQDAISRLTNEHKITSPSQIKDVKVRLETAAKLYLDLRARHKNKARPSQSKSKITEIKTHLDALIEKINSLDTQTAGIFWSPEIEVDTLVPIDENPSKTTIRESPYGHTIVTEPFGEDGCKISFLTKPDYLESLDILRNYCSTALEHIPADKGAALKSNSKRMWIINIRNLWVDGLGRDFTLSYHKGKPTSDAACFCCDAFEVIEPELPAKKIISEMKQLITAENKRHTGKNTPSK